MSNDTTILLAFLKKIAAEQNHCNPDIKISPLTTRGANYSSRLYTIKITSDDKQDLQLFAKIAAITEEMRKQTVLAPYDCERFMYTELFKTYRRLEDKWNLSEQHRLVVPKYYGADTTYMQEVLVLEDLACQGYTLHNRLEPVSWEYAAAAVTQLARFHALSHAFQHENPTEFDNVTNMLPQGMYTNHEGNHAYYNSSMKSAISAVREENKEKLERFINGTNLANFSAMYRTVRRPVLINGDFRPSNMLHRVREGGALELMVVDYQTNEAGCSIIDLMIFIFTATDGPFRAKHYQQLLEYYYTELGAALARLGLDVETVYSRQDFEFEIKETLPFGLHLSVLHLPMTLISEEDAPKLDKELNMAKLAIQASGSLYVRRLNEVIDDYVVWGVLV